VLEAALRCRRDGTWCGVNLLTLVPAEETYHSDSAVISVPFLDFVVDGVSLRDLTREAGVGQDLVTPLARAWVPSAVSSAIYLLARGTGHGELADVLICRVCGDRDCGALLAEITVTDAVVTWANWRWTDHETEPEPIGDVLPVFQFDVTVYGELLRSASSALAAMPYEPPVRGRVTVPWKWGWRLPRRSK
jgi:hypothetical protein